jgi:predicted phage-related endonuclease
MGLEIKARGHRQAWKWGAEVEGAAGVPDEVQAQAHWYMALTEAPLWDVAVLLDGNDFRVYRLQRDTEIETAMMDAGEKFWRDHVERDVPPAFDGGDAAWTYLQKRFAGKKAISAEPTPEVEALALELERAKVDIADAEKREATIRQKICDIAADLGVRSFKGQGWSFSVVEQKGKTTWKTVAAALYERLQLAADERTRIEEACRGRSFVAPRFTSKRIATKDED